MQEIDWLIGADRVLTMDERLTEFENGMVAVDQGRIVAVGTKQELEGRFKARQTAYKKHHVLMPGFVNTHTHAAMNVFRGVAEDMALHTWLNDHIFPLEAKFVDPEMVRVGNRLALTEMLRTGTTTFNDMYFFEDLTARQASEMQIRAVLSEGLLDFPSPSFAKPADGVAFMRELLQQYRGHELVTIAVASHAPYTCSPELMKGTKKLADEFNAPWHIHLAETKWEFDKYMKEFGMTPTQYLDSFGLLAPNTIAAHAVHLTRNDVELMALREAGVAHNPECNMKLASGVAPIQMMWDYGVKVGIGTDGAASNNNLDVLQELHTAALLQKLQTNDPKAAEASKMVRMATIEGAKVLGLDQKIGSLEVGKEADMISINTRTMHALPRYNVYSQLVHATNSLDVQDVWVAGKQVLRNGDFVSIDVEAIYNEVEALAAEIKHYQQQKRTTAAVK